MHVKRVRYIISLLIVLFLGLIYVSVQFKQNRCLGLKELSTDDLQSIISDKTEISILKNRLLINGENIPYDCSEDVFFVTQCLSENTWQGEISLKEKKLSEKIYIIIPQEDKQAIMSENVHCKICYIDSSESTYQISDVVISGLPVISISDDEMLLFSANKDDINISKADVTLEQRGSTAFHYEKKSYNLKLEDEKKSLVGLRTDEDWILNALYDDMGMIHNQFSYQVWNEMASTEDWQGNYAVNQEYAELLLEGEYQGVYALSERVDKQQLMMSDNDILFKVIGYPQHSGGDAMELKYPKESTFETDALKNVILEHFCNENEIPLKNSLILLDYQNALDYNIFCQLATAADNPVKNSYFVGRRALDFYKLCEVPWDCNITWGIKHYILTNEERIYDTEFKSLVFSVLEEKDPQKLNLDIANRWFLLRQDILSEDNLNAILEENFSLLHDSGAYERNYLKWPTVSVCVGEEGEILDAPVSEIWKDENIYHFVEKRLEVLDEYYQKFL